MNKLFALRLLEAEAQSVSAATASGSARSEPTTKLRSPALPVWLGEGEVDEPVLPKPLVGLGA